MSPDRIFKALSDPVRIKILQFLRKPEGVALLKRLLPGFDVLIENFRPGTLDRWGLDKATLWAVQPRLGILRATGTPLVIHSTAIWLLAETGLAGFLVFFFWAWRTYSTAFANRKTLWGLTLVLVLTVFAVISQAHDMLYQRAFWLMLGALLIVPLDARALHNSGPERPRPTL